ncbi:hypothetical protein [Microbacterium sp. B19(2022)]|uniref:hypothetical protein n=1 Tax=Microbacterium sp. B19(2022) TaxID=2914045 RepID=UPI001F3B7158|nr:hypothetical protein [Microbacterium sp. B19(2022)]
MLPSSPDRMLRVRADRTLIARAVTAVGLALLLVIGAWSSSHGPADVHATLCLASGVSSPVDTVAPDRGTDSATAVDVLSSDIGVCVLAVLCGIALVLLFLRLPRRGARPLGARIPRLTSPSRAGPRLVVPALSLTQLSISRT